VQGGSGLGPEGGSSPFPEHATFHLNYTQEIDWSKCAERDFVVFDLLETPTESFSQCQSAGAKMLCYFSSQYEDFRDDSASFGELGEPLDGWPGEYWVDPTDPQNLEVMRARLDIAVEKGCDGVDIDNIDRDGHEDYVIAIFDEARQRGLWVSQKNAIEKIVLFYDHVDLYQNEQCQEYDECAAYEGLGRPVYNIEYTPCETFGWMYSNRKDVEAMDAWEEACAP
jgi:endo-alpha-1,4-polygalactosaminidase (GH114 family)